MMTVQYVFEHSPDTNAQQNPHHQEYLAFYIIAKILDHHLIYLTLKKRCKISLWNHALRTIFLPVFCNFQYWLKVGIAEVYKNIEIVVNGLCFVLYGYIVIVPCIIVSLDIQLFF